LKKTDAGFRCEECKLIYRECYWAEKCEEWCREYKSCNLEITKHAINKSKLRLT
jgi:hypothetical protein